MKNRYLLSIIILFLSLNSNLAMSQSPYHPEMGTKDYVEYIEGNMPFVISIPHDGMLKPEGILNRTCTRCSKNQDIHTQEIGRAMREHIFKLIGLYPYMIISHLHRSKLDPNRSIQEAATGHKEPELAWTEFHAYIERAITEVEEKFGKGLYIDLHGHRHKVERIELGYLVSGEELRFDDDFLNDESFYEYSSLRSLINNNLKSTSYIDLLRGPESFGSMLENQGYTTVPSLNIPFPKENEPLFSGGFNTKKHSSVTGGTVDGIQVEIGIKLREDAVRRIEFAETLSEVVLKYLKTYYFEDLSQ
jgi:hypothetical protein